MKNTIIIMSLFFALVINAQSEQQQDSTKTEIHFGVNGGIIIPFLDMEMADEILFGFGATLDIFPSKPTITFGVDFIRDKNAMLTTFSVGPSMGKDKGGYFSPAITMSSTEDIDENIYGIDLGGGYLFDGDDVRFNLSFKYSFVNIFNFDHDKLMGEGRILIGVYF